MNAFVAGFMGNPPMNLFPTRLETEAGRVVFRIGDQVAPAGERPATLMGRALTGGIRPEAVTLVSEGGAALRASVAHVELLGHETLVYVDVGDVRLVARAPGMAALSPGDRVGLRLDPAGLHVFEENTAK